MKSASCSVALIGFDPGGASKLKTAFLETDDVKVHEIEGGLTSLNGHAVTLASAHDVILFRTDAATGEDISALEEIRQKKSGSARIIALTQGSASLDAAHRLARAGADQVLPDTMTLEELRDEILAVRQKQTQGAEATAARQPGRILAVAQSRGGVGSTTVAVNLADTLLERKGTFNKRSSKRVAIVDLDLQYGAVSAFLDVTTGDALYHLASEQTMPDALFLEQAMAETDSGLSVLTAPARFAPVDALQPHQVRAILEILSDQFDYVVIDLPRLLVDWVAPVLELTDRLLLVTDTSVPSIQQARRLIDFYTENNMGLQVDIVVNGEKKPLVKGRHHKEAEKVLQRPLKIWLPEDPRVAREAVDRGVPVASFAARSPLARGMKRLGQDVISAFEHTRKSKKAGGLGVRDV